MRAPRVEESELSSIAQTVRRAPPLPERIGRYEVVSRLASGAMGVVYLGRVHGMGGFNAAQSALRYLGKGFEKRSSQSL